MRSMRRRVFDVVAAAVVATWLLPLYWISLTSIKPESAIIIREPVFVSFMPTFDNYALLFTRFEFGRVVVNSLLIVGISTMITILLAIPAAYSLTRLKLKRRNDIAFFILSLRFMPGVVVLLPYYLMFQAIGLSDSLAGMILIYVGFGLPFAVWLLRGFFRDIPKDVEEAARIDNLSTTQIIWKMMVPMARSGIAVTTIFTFVFGWNEYLYALVLTESRAITIPIQMSKMIDAYSVLWGPLSAAVVLQLLPMVVLIFALQRHLVRGLTLGAVK